MIGWLWTAAFASPMLLPRLLSIVVEVWIGATAGRHAESDAASRMGVTPTVSGDPLPDLPDSGG